MFLLNSRVSSPLGPFTVTTLSLLVISTPAGNVITLLPIRDIVLFSPVRLSSRLCDEFSRGCSNHFYQSVDGLNSVEKEFSTCFTRFMILPNVSDNFSTNVLLTSFFICQKTFRSRYDRNTKSVKNFWHVFTFCVNTKTWF